MLTDESRTELSFFLDDFSDMSLEMAGDRNVRNAAAGPQGKPQFTRADRNLLRSLDERQRTLDRRRCHGASIPCYENVFGSRIESPVTRYEKYRATGT